MLLFKYNKKKYIGLIINRHGTKKKLLTFIVPSGYATVVDMEINKNHIYKKTTFKINEIFVTKIIFYFVKPKYSYHR